MSARRVTVVSIVGMTRSGSTLLDNLLGAFPGVFSGGEVRYLWLRGLLQGWRCGCGERIYNCPVWTEVLGRLERSLPTEFLSPDAVVDLQKKVARTRHTAGILRERPAPRADGSLVQRYLYVLDRLYRAMAETTGAVTLIDSSKRPSDAVLASLLDLDTYAVHLVRDPRAVSFSWRRARGAGREEEPMPSHGPLYAGIRWLVINAVAPAACRRAYGDDLVEIRYEDLVEAPRSNTRRIASIAGIETQPDPFVGEHRVHVGTNHAIPGNPSRFATGTIDIRADDAWRRRIRRADRLVTTTLALPLLHRFGYPWSSLSVQPGRAHEGEARG